MKVSTLEIILFIAVLVLGYLYIEKPGPEPVNDKPYKDSIKVISHQIDSFNLINKIQASKIDSLELLKARVIVLYKDKYILIRNTTNVRTLDSIIKAGIHGY